MRSSASLVRLKFRLFSDFYTRTHAASITDTLGAGLILLGLTLQVIPMIIPGDQFVAGSWIILVKLLMVGLFILLTAPTSGHALVKAAYAHGLVWENTEGDDVSTGTIFFILLIIVAVLVTRLTNLRMPLVMFAGIFNGLLSNGLFTMMDAVDVAFFRSSRRRGYFYRFDSGHAVFNKTQETPTGTQNLTLGMVVIVGLLSFGAPWA